MPTIVSERCSIIQRWINRQGIYACSSSVGPRHGAFSIYDITKEESELYKEFCSNCSNPAKRVTDLTAWHPNYSKTKVIRSLVQLNLLRICERSNASKGWPAPESTADEILVFWVVPRQPFPNVSQHVIKSQRIGWLAPGRSGLGRSIHRRFQFRAAGEF
jgi:hypothetical protein